jgi:hypothetical protein
MYASLMRNPVGIIKLGRLRRHPGKILNWDIRKYGLRMWLDLCGSG